MKPIKPAQPVIKICFYFSCIIIYFIYQSLILECYYEAKKKVLFICPYPKGVQAGQRFKYEQYFDLFQSNNFDIQVSFSWFELWKIIYQPGNLLKKMF